MGNFEKVEVAAEKDKSFSASIDSIDGLVLVNRPQEGAPYELYFKTDRRGEEEVMVIGEDATVAERDFGAIVDFLRSKERGTWQTMEQVKAATRDFIANLQGGVQETG